MEVARALDTVKKGDPCFRCTHNPIQSVSLGLCASCSVIYYTKRCLLPPEERGAFTVARCIQLYPAGARGARKPAKSSITAIDPSRVPEIHALVSHDVAKRFGAALDEIVTLFRCLADKIGDARKIIGELEERKDIPEATAIVVRQEPPAAPLHGNEATDARCAVTHEPPGAGAVVREPTPAPPAPPRPPTPAPPPPRPTADEPHPTSPNEAIAGGPQPVPIARPLPLAQETAETLLAKADYHQSRQILTVIFYETREKRGIHGIEEKTNIHVRFSRSLLKRLLGPLYDDVEITREVMRAMMLLYRSWVLGGFRSSPNESERYFRSFVYRLKRDTKAMDQNFYSFLRYALGRDRAQDQVDLSHFCSIIGFVPGAE